MSLLPSDLLMYPSRADADDAIAAMQSLVITATTDKVKRFARRLFQRCQETGIDFAYAFAHAVNECNFFRDSDWTDDTNAFGIGNTDGSGGVVFPSPEACADFFVWELLTKMGQDASDMAFVRDYAPAKFDRVTAIVTRSDFPTVRRISDLNKKFGDNDCVWMCDESGPEAIVSKSRILFPNLPDQSTEPPTGGEPPVGTFTTNVPGLPGGPLVTTYPIRFNLTAVDGFQRTGQKARTPRRSIQHGTDNPNNQSAWQEAQYFVNGAEGRQASVHSFADDNEVVIGVPLDEVAWQAADGAGPGNMNGFACEMMEATAIWQNTARRNKLIAIAADFMGRCAARLGATKPERHWDFNAGSADRHHCPNLLMNTGLWDSMYVPMWQAARADELKRMNGETEPQPKPEPKYATPDVPDFVEGDAKLGYPRNHSFKNTTAFACLREWTVKKATPRRLTSTTKSKEVGPALKSGERFPGWYVFKSGSSWWILTKGGTRVAMADMTDRVTISTR